MERSFATKDRPTERPVAPQMYEYIAFQASDTKDLYVCEAPSLQLTLSSGLLNDPAIVQHSVPISSFHQSGSFGPIGALPVSYQQYSSFSGLPYIPQPYVTSSSLHSGNHQHGSRQGRNRQNSAGRSKDVLQLEEYDFDQANAEFQELERRLAKMKIESPSSSEQCKNEDKKEKLWPDNGSAGNTPKEDEIVYYDKTKSFFDNISYEAAERSKGNIRHDWRRERKLNAETFGLSANSNWTRRNTSRGRRSYGRGYRGYRGGGGRPGVLSGDRGFGPPLQSRWIQ